MGRWPRVPPSGDRRSVGGAGREDGPEHRERAAWPGADGAGFARDALTQTPE